MFGVASANALRGLRGGSRVFGALSKTTTTQRRLLSSTQSRQASKIIHFTKCSSPELDETLKTIREQLILPVYLPVEQRKKIYSEKNKAALDRDPITVEIDGEVVQFGYRDMMQLPNTRYLMKQAITAMKTPADFNNLWPLLEGVCFQAGRQMPPMVFRRALRKADNAGCLGVILECVKNVKKTKFRLDDHELVAHLLLAIQRVAFRSGWQEQETVRALKRVQLVLDLLEGEPEHQEWVKRNTKVKFAYPFHRDPIFLAAGLHMGAALALKHHKGKDMDGVAGYARQLVALWPESAGLLELQPKSAFVVDGVDYLMNPQQTITIGSVVVSALRLAAKVVEPELAAELEKRAALVQPEVDRAVAELDDGRREWFLELAGHKELFGPESLLA
ncbi:hypothetical protein B0T16DRAFT_458328 [Cercophora newfieldiana]|uniref:Uncharacterized protein n=1 Tax=Cercophora newfieldiana TaxID=92897 RepID=A0AA39Y7F9_9PEZI|nr:hypothetical protein B0T16DRAFT_458328 [Cercophora newfieldiana]